MPEQNFANHTRYVTPFHKVLLPILGITSIGSFVNLFQSIGDHSRFYNAALIAVIAVSVTVLSYYARAFPLRAQDRAIRAEQNLRHFVLVSKLLDPRLNMTQILALRFAPDVEFIDLARKAADQGLPSVEIKKSIKNWQADNDRA